MGANGPISVWHSVRNYTPGMKLGKPDEIIPAPSMLEKGSQRPTIVSPNNRAKKRSSSMKKSQVIGRPKKFATSKEEYIGLRRSGLTRGEIAEKYSISIDTLRHHLGAWGIGKKNAELAAMEQS